MRCAGCGYGPEWHQAGTGKCPSDEPGKYLLRAKWRDPPPPGPASWREVVRQDAERRAAEHAAAHAPYVPDVIPPPRVPARSPRGPGELAGYGGRQAVGLGRRAVVAGWQVRAHYWQAHDGAEGCAVAMRRDDLYAVATWKRKPGKQGSRSGWEADDAYGVRRGDLPVKLTHTQLEGVITA